MTQSLVLTIRDWSRSGKLLASVTLTDAEAAEVMAHLVAVSTKPRVPTLAERKAEHTPLCGGHLCVTCLGFDHAELDERLRAARGA